MLQFFAISFVLTNALIHAKTCQKTAEVYTECSEAGSDRWAVYIPLEEDCEAPNPVKLASCDKTCEKGEYLKGTSNCTKCDAGQYSYGDETVYDVLDKDAYPDVNHVSSKINQADSKECHAISREENMVVLPTDLCWYIVTVPVTLLKPGSAVLHYIAPDTRTSLVFSLLELNNAAKCSSGTAIQEKEGTPSPKWTTVQFKIAQKGSYIMEIKSTAYFNAEPITDESVPISPVRLGKFTVSGVKPATQCNACPAGHTANRTGSYSCSPCPPNTYTVDHVTCVPCAAAQYSLPAASSCVKQVACTHTDYTPSFSACVDGKTTVTGLPKVAKKCLNDPPKTLYECSRCSPGTEFNKAKGRCDFCQDGTVSKNGSQCQACEPNYISLPGLYYVWWSEIPEGWVAGCPDDTSNCFVAAGAYLLGSSANSQVSVLALPEVKYSTKSITAEVVGLFSVKFILDCPAECSFLIIQESKYKPRQGHETVYKRQVVKQRYSSSGDVEAVLEVTKHENTDGKFFLHLSGAGATVQLHEVHYTNTAQGGAKHCFPCKGSGCQECSPGMISQAGKCTPCPANSYHLVSGSILNSDYSSACVPCSEGTISSPGSTSCYAPCHLITSSNNSYSLSDDVVFEQPDSFPDSEGNTFHYRFKMKLCSNDNRMPLVECTEEAGSEDVKSQICQVNVVTDVQGNVTTTHPTSKGDTLSSITELDNGIKLQYVTLQRTAQCNSVTTDISLLCNRDSTVSEMRITRRDTCSISFEHSGPFGCKKCQDADYANITSACVRGEKNTTYVLTPGVVCSGGVGLPPVQSETCTVYEDTLLNSIKRFKLLVGLGIGGVLLLVVGLCFLTWYSTTLKHQLDGYSQMSCGKDNGYLGTNNTLQFDWEESEEEQEDLYTKSTYKPPTPGAVLIQKISNLNKRMGIRKYKNLDNVDLLRMPTDASSSVGI